MFPAQKQLTQTCPNSQFKQFKNNLLFFPYNFVKKQHEIISQHTPPRVWCVTETATKHKLLLPQLQQLAELFNTTTSTHTHTHSTAHFQFNLFPLCQE